MNQNTLAKTVVAREGLKESVNIAQVKEIIRLTLEELAKLPGSQVLSLIEKHSESKS